MYFLSINFVVVVITLLLLLFNFQVLIFQLLSLVSLHENVTYVTCTGTGTHSMHASLVVPLLMLLPLPLALHRSCRAMLHVNCAVCWQRSLARCARLLGRQSTLTHAIRCIGSLSLGPLCAPPLVLLYFVTATIPSTNIICFFLSSFDFIYFYFFAVELG